MNVTEADTVLEVLSGYWPTPALTEEELKVWVTELCGRMRITFEEAAKVITAWARSGETFRLRPGQIVAEVQALRRRRAFDRPIAELVPAFEIAENHDEIRENTIAACRVAIAEGSKAMAQRQHERRVRSAVS
jgi:hypothetical protein